MAQRSFFQCFFYSLALGWVFGNILHADCSFSLFPSLFCFWIYICPGSLIFSGKDYCFLFSYRYYFHWEYSNIFASRLEKIFFVSLRSLRCPQLYFFPHFCFFDVLIFGSLALLLFCFSFSLFIFLVQPCLKYFFSNFSF